MSTSGNASPSIQEIRAKCQEVFGCKPFLWQCRALEATLKGSDVIIDVGTGAGKTLAFFLPLLFRPSGIQIIVTALNILGQQNVETLQRARVTAISISAECATAQNFQVCNFEATSVTKFNRQRLTTSFRTSRMGVIVLSWLILNS